MERKRVLSSDLTRYINARYPYTASNSLPYKHQAIIGIGGNMGDTKRVFDRLFFFLQRTKNLHLLATSSILKNPPFGYLNQPFFYNAVIVVQTNLCAHALLQKLQNIEKKFGRKRSFKDAPRTLDLDILFYDNRTINTKKLTIPHPGWAKRESVVIPLMEVAII